MKADREQTSAFVNLIRQQCQPPGLVRIMAREHFKLKLWLLGSDFYTGPEDCVSRNKTMR